MRTTTYLAAIAALSLSLAACTPTRATHGADPGASPVSQTIELPLSAGDGAGKEVAVLLDAPHLKVVTITLRNGTALPPHSAPVPVTIQVLAGEGTIHVGGRPVPVTEGSLVSLVAGEEHDVLTPPGGDMVLVVHYLRRGR